MSSITISTALLAAIAKWAADDTMIPHLCCVVFHDGELYATDGYRLVRMPIGDKKFSAAIARHHILAAAAAQRELRGNGRKQIAITVDGVKATLDLGPAAMTVRQVDMTPHTREVLDATEPKYSTERVPDGHVFNPALLAAIGEVHNAARDGGGELGVKLAKWGAPDGNGDLLEPVVLTGAGGTRFVVMPMRERS